MTTESELTEAEETEHRKAFGPAPAPSRTSGNAIAALILGLFPTLGIASVLAIVFGLRARREIERDPTIRGRGMATAGIVLGIIGLVVSIAAWLLVITAVVSGASG